MNRLGWVSTVLAMTVLGGAPGVFGQEVPHPEEGPVVEAAHPEEEVVPEAVMGFTVEEEEPEPDDNGNGNGDDNDKSDKDIYIEMSNRPKEKLRFGERIPSKYFPSLDRSGDVLQLDKLSDEYKIVADVRPAGTVKITWDEGAKPPSVRYWRYTEPPGNAASPKREAFLDSKANQSAKGRAQSFCGDVFPRSDERLIEVNLVGLRCRGEAMGKGALIEIVNDESKAVYIEVSNRFLPRVGSDQGIALTMVDRWEDNMGADINTGVSYYYSIANLKTSKVRLIAHLTALDVEDAEDSAAAMQMTPDDSSTGGNGGETMTPAMSGSDELRIGIGIGALFKTGAEIGKVGGPGLAIAAGIGYDLMADSGEEPWYTFVGLSVNFQAKSSQ